MTEQSINKDLLIDVLNKENDTYKKLNETLKQLNKVQAEQLSSFRERIAMFEILVQKMAEQEDMQNRLIKEQNEKVEILQQKNQTLGNLISVKEKYIKELGGELPTMDS